MVAEHYAEQYPAIALRQALGAERQYGFEQVLLPMPKPQGRDLLVRVKALSVNPVATKVRTSIKEPLAEPRVLGWDAAGVVEAVGEATWLFKPGDEVYYAGSLPRAGSNGAYQLVDERIVGRKPSNLSFEEAAALPLTTITAWEALFERLGFEPKRTSENLQRKVLIINGAGGVGSIAIQLASRVAGLQVIATASRPESQAWCRQMGAEQVLDHHGDLPGQLEELGIAGVDAILCLHSTDQHWQAMAAMVKPLGKICAVVTNQQPLAMELLKNKCVTFVWEFMFTPSMYGLEAMIGQHELLDAVAARVEAGELQTTLQEQLGPLTVESLAQAHGRLESGQMIGKLVLSGMS